MPTPTLYIGNKNYSSWSLRPWFLLTAREIPFTEKLVPFVDGGSWEAFREFSPSGKVPCLHDGDLVVWDSLAIVEHLAEKHSGVWPDDPIARAWARSAAAEMHAGFAALRNDCPMTVGLRIRRRQGYEISDALATDVARVDELWCQGLERFGGPFLTGAQPTAVDAFYAPVVFRVQTYSLELSAAASGYWRWMLELPAMQSWTAAALVEPWREAAHEQEIRGIGEVVEDLRSGPKE
jgi:glutathione S-transferase